MGVKKLYEQGLKGCIVSTSPDAEIIPVFMKDIEGEGGIIKPRLVDLSTGFCQMVLNDMHVLREEDLQRAGHYISNPSEFDFHKILAWEYDPSATLRPAE